MKLICLLTIACLSFAQAEEKCVVVIDSVTDSKIEETVNSYLANGWKVKEVEGVAFSSYKCFVFILERPDPKGKIQVESAAIFGSF